MPDVTLPGYDAPFGNRKKAVTTHQGPANYQQPGENLNASTFGWGSFDMVHGSRSFNANNSGNFVAIVLYPTAQSPAVSANSMVGGAPSGSNYVTLQWLYAANGAQPANGTNLSSEFCRLDMLGC